MKKNRWRIYGILYFSALFVLIPSLASAYIDPSVTTYAIQAIAGVVVAAGAFFATYGRRMKKSWMQTLDLDENASRATEAPLEITREDLKAELAKKREILRAHAVFAVKKQKNIKGRLITSLLCSFAVALTIVLRPVISFYLTNEREFWFELGEVIWAVLAVFGAVMLGVFLVHFLLPGSGKIDLRFIFASFALAISLGVFIQNHFMSSYLPVLTGEPVDWSQYASWGIASLVLWIGLILVFAGGSIIRPRWFKGIVYGLFALLICTETIAGGVDLLTANYEPRELKDSFFSREGIFETSTKGNIVVFVSDTFEGTYMNEILEEYPEVKELLPEVTYYDNTTGIGSMTYLSYTKLLTGLEFPIGSTESEGIEKTFLEESLVSGMAGNGWDIAYYTDFNPTPNLQDKILNYNTGHVKPSAWASWAVAKRLLKSSLFRSSPQQLKDHFTVYTNEYEVLKSHMLELEPGVSSFSEDDQWFYWTMKDRRAIEAVNTEKPRYALIQLWGLHDPSVLETDFVPTHFDDSVSLHERKLKAGRAMLALIREYLDQLKTEGTYDNTTVIMTADHGFNMRYYPVLLVKEAGSVQKEFRVDDTPLSLYEDFEPLMLSLTSGKSFSQAVKDLNYPPDRERKAVDFRSLEGYSKKTDRRTEITIKGEAKELGSYIYGNDEYLLNDNYAGRCEPGEKFILGGEPQGTVGVYGISDGKAYGHSVAFDAFFDTKSTRSLELKIKLRNITEKEQKIRFRIDERIIAEELIAPCQEKGLNINLPKKMASRWTIFMDMPNAEQRVATEKVLAWVSFNSVEISEAELEERPK